MKSIYRKPKVLVNLEPVPTHRVGDNMRVNLGQAQTELRLLRAQNSALRETKHELAQIRGRVADVFYALSEPIL